MGEKEKRKISLTEAYKIISSKLERGERLDSEERYWLSELCRAQMGEDLMAKHRQLLEQDKEDKFKSFEDRLSRAYEILLDKIEKRASLSDSQYTIFKDFCDYASNYFDAKQYQEFSSEQERDPMQGIKEEKRALTYDLIRNRVVLGERPTQEERLFMRLYCAEHGIEISKTGLEGRKKSDEELSSSEQERDPMQGIEEEKRAQTYDLIRNRLVLGERPTQEERLFMRSYCAEHGIEISKTGLEGRKKSDEEPSR